MIAQFRTQLRRLPRQVVYGKTPLDTSLSAMGEIEERLDDALNTRQRLLTIKKAANEELAALESIQQVDEARRSLADLKRRVRFSRGGFRDPRRDPPLGTVHSGTQQACGDGDYRPLPGTLRGQLN